MIKLGQSTVSLVMIRVANNLGPLVMSRHRPPIIELELAIDASEGLPIIGIIMTLGKSSSDIVC